MLLLRYGLSGMHRLQSDLNLRATSKYVEQLNSAKYARSKTNRFPAGFIHTNVALVIKSTYQSSGESAFKFKPFSSEGAYHSFPSGHTILSITMAHSIAKQFENPWVKAGIYTIGSIPPISRLIDGAHWLTDIAFGAVISIVVVDSIDKFLFSSKSYDYPKKEKQISWNLKLSTNQIGIVGTF